MSVIIRLQQLSWNATAADIRDFFRGLQIPEGGVHIVGGTEGDAFIAFASDEDARQAMRLDSKKIKDQRIKLLLSSRVEMQKVIEQARGDFAAASANAQANDILTDVLQPSPAPHSFTSPAKDRSWNNTTNSSLHESPVKLGSNYGRDGVAGAGAVSGFSSFPSSTPHSKDLASSRTLPPQGEHQFGALQTNKQGFDGYVPNVTSRYGSQLQRNEASRRGDKSGDDIIEQMGAKTMRPENYEATGYAQNSNNMAHPPEPTSFDYMHKSKQSAFTPSSMEVINKFIDNRDPAADHYIQRDWRDGGNAPPPPGFDSGDREAPAATTKGRSYGRDFNEFGRDGGVWKGEQNAHMPLPQMKPAIDEFDRRSSITGYPSREMEISEGPSPSSSRVGIPARPPHHYPGSPDFDPAHTSSRIQQNEPYTRENLGDVRPVHAGFGLKMEEDNPGYGKSKPDNFGQIPLGIHAHSGMGRNESFEVKSEEREMEMHRSGGDRGSRFNGGMGRPGDPHYHQRYNGRPIGRQDMGHPNIPINEPRQDMRLPPPMVKDPAPNMSRPGQASQFLPFGGDPGYNQIEDDFRRVGDTNWRGGGGGISQRGRAARPILLPSPAAEVGNIVTNVPPPIFVPSKDSDSRPMDDVGGRGLRGGPPVPPFGPHFKEGPRDQRLHHFGHFGFADPAPDGPFGDLPHRGLPMPPDPMHRIPQHIGPDSLHRQQHMESFIVLDRLPPEMKQYKVLKDFLRSGGVQLDKEEPVKISRENKSGQHILTAYVRLPSPAMAQLALRLNGKNGIRVVPCKKEDFDWAGPGFKQGEMHEPLPHGHPTVPNPWLSGAPPGPGRHSLLNMPFPDPARIKPVNTENKPGEFVVELSNLPYRVLPDDVMQLFGESRPVRLIRGAKEGTECDVWFAIFDWSIGFEAALHLKGTNIMGRTIRVHAIDKVLMDKRLEDLSRRWDRDRRGSPSRDRARHRDSRDKRDRSRSRDRERSRRSASSQKDKEREKDRDREREKDRDKGDREKDRKETKAVDEDKKGDMGGGNGEAHDAIHMTGLPLTVTERDVNAFLLRLQVHPSTIRLMKEPPASAYALFSRISDCAKVMSCKTLYIGPNKINIRSCHSSEMTSEIKKQFASLQADASKSQNGQPSNGQSSIKPAEDVEVEDPAPKTAGQSSPAQKGPPIDLSVIRSIGAQGCVLVLHNLPPTVSLDELSTFFSGFNLLEDSVRMHYNDTGTATGDALLAVGSPWDAQNAVKALDQQVLHGFTVRMYCADS